MAVSILDTLVDSGAISVGSPGSFSPSAGADRQLLYIQIYRGDTQDITAVSWGNQPMTEVVTAFDPSGFDIRCRLWILGDVGIAAGVGTDFAVTGTTNGQYRHFAMTLAGVDQASPFNDTAVIEGGLTAGSANLDTLTDGFALAFGATAGIGDITWAGITEQTEVDDTGMTRSVAYDLTSTTQTITIDPSETGGNSQAMAAASFRSSSAGPGVVLGAARSRSTSRGRAAATLLPESTPGLNLGNRRIHVSKSGNDANTGFSSAQAKLTIQAALNIAQTNDIISIGSGHYFETPSRANVAGPVWLVPERRGEVTVSNYWPEAYDGTLVWDDEGNGTYSAVHGSVWSGSDDHGDFLFRYQSRADLEAATLTIAAGDSLLGSTNVIAKPQYGFAEEGGRIYVKLRDGGDPNGRRIKLTDSFSQTIFNFDNCDNWIIDGIRAEGAGDTPAIDFSASSAAPTVRNCISDHSRGLCRVSSNALVEWCEFTYEGFGQWMRELTILDGLDRVAIFDMVKNYNNTGGNAHYGGGIAFGTSSNDTGNTIRFNWIHGLFEGVRGGEHNNTDVHDNVIEDIGDNAIQFESFRGSDTSSDIRFFHNLVLQVHDSPTSHQPDNDFLGPHYVFGNVIECTDPNLSRPRFIIKTIQGATNPNNAGIHYYNNLFKARRGATVIANPDDRSSIWGTNQSGDDAETIDTFINNAAIYEDGLDDNLAANQQPVTIANNILAAPSDSATFQSNGGSRVANEAAMLLGANRQLLAGSPLIGAGTPQPGGLPTVVGTSDQDVGPFENGFDPGPDWPRVRSTTFDATIPAPFFVLQASSASVSGGQASAFVQSFASATSASISGGQASGIGLVFAQSIGASTSGGLANASEFTGARATSDSISGGSASALPPVVISPPLPIEVSFSSAQRPVLLVDLFFDSGEINIWTRPNTGIFAQKEYSPLADIQSGVTIRNSLDSNVFDASIQLSGQSQEILSIALNENYRNRRADIILGNIDTAGEIEAIEEIFSGFIVNMPVTDDNKKSTVSIQIESIFRTINRLETRRLSSADLAVTSADDSFFDFIETTSVVEPTFGGS